MPSNSEIRQTGNAGFGKIDISLQIPGVRTLIFLNISPMQFYFWRQSPQLVEI
jgi:hypothetical protein